MKETVDTLRSKSKDEVIAFIREKLTYDLSDEQWAKMGMNSNQEHKRSFDMSGYESKTGMTTVRNQSILNTFAYLGIYDYTSYLFLDFYKGTPTLYMQYWMEDENLNFDFPGYSTSQIIYEVFQKTIFSGKNTRRRI